MHHRDLTFGYFSFDLPKVYYLITAVKQLRSAQKLYVNKLWIPSDISPSISK